MLVPLLCSVSAASACLQCDRKIRLLHEDFILSEASVEDQIKLKKICDHVYTTYQRISRERKGVIGKINTQFGAIWQGMTYRWSPPTVNLVGVFMICPLPLFTPTTINLFLSEMPKV